MFRFEPPYTYHLNFEGVDNVILGNLFADESWDQYELYLSGKPENQDNIDIMNETTFMNGLNSDKPRPNYQWFGFNVRVR